jgi:hypothetical protein
MKRISTPNIGSSSGTIRSDQLILVPAGCSVQGGDFYSDHIGEFSSDHDSGEGKHEGFLPEQLFEECQQVRAGFARTFKTEAVMRTYVLHDRVYCAHCVSNMPSGLVDENYGKMRPYWDKRREYGYYRCLCKERGYRPCPQYAIQEDSVNEQVIDVLTHLEIPDNFRDRVETAVRDRVENEAALKRMEEIREIIERIDLRWDHGFISQEEYVEKRGQLQREVEALRPIDYDEMNEAADLVQYLAIIGMAARRWTTRLKRASSYCRKSWTRCLCTTPR